MDDQDFDDLIFALKPVDVFAALPEVENRKSSTNGVYAFEDLWPKAGDYDLNDALVNVKHEKEFNDKGKIIKETFYFTTYQNYVELTSGLALTLDTNTTPQSIVMKKMTNGSTVAEDDCSDPSKNLYFVREGNYPFAFYLHGANISVFENTILKRENESKRIDEFFPGFLEWSTSNGTKNQDWYIK